MCKALLGEHFDIHGGGLDLQFPHHENEIAQSEGASGGPFANVWMHNGLLNVDNEKMSKSLGNFFTIRDVLKRYDGETLRFFMLRTHYRSPVELQRRQPRRRAQRAAPPLHRARRRRRPSAAGRAIDWTEPRAAAFRAAMNDDFNTPLAVAVLFDLAGEVNRTPLAGDARAAARRSAATLGLLQQAPRAFLQAGSRRSTRRASPRASRRARAAKARATSRAPTRSATSSRRTASSCRTRAQGTTWVKA